MKISYKNRLEMHFVNRQSSNMDIYSDKYEPLSEKETPTDKKGRRNTERHISGRQTLGNK